jgi:hypothetical protein
VKRTTDEWTERFFGQAAKDIDCHISMSCSDLTPDQAYTLRRHIMITLRHGVVGVDHLTDEIDKLEAEIAQLRKRLKAAYECPENSKSNSR